MATVEALQKELGKAPSAKPLDAEPSSRRLLLLLHGEKANDDLVRDAVNRLRQDGHQITVRVTFESGDVDRLVKEALTLKTADTLVAAGGDGTVCEVVDAVLKHTGGIKDTRAVSDAPEPVVRAHGDPPRADTVSVAILPLGTSNDFAATTGLPQDPYEALLLATRRDSIKRIDVGLLNGKVFVNTATIGASAEVGKMTSSGLKRVLGPFAFIFTGMRAATQWKPVSSVLCFPNIKEHGAYKEQKEPPTREGESLAKTLSAEMDADKAFVAKGSKVTAEPSGPSSSTGPTTTGSTPTLQPTPSLKAAAKDTGTEVAELQGVPLLHLTAANNRQIASMVSIAPDAVLDDGMLDCIYLTGAVGDQAKRVLKELIVKGPGGTRAVSTLLRVPWLEVASSEPLEWSLDGDPQKEPVNRFRFSLLHRAIQLHLPDERMLVAGQPTPTPEDTQLADTRKKGQRKANSPLKLPRGRLRPPSIKDMISSVTRFRKKKNWSAILRSMAITTLQVVVYASLGAGIMHYVHTRGNEDGTRGNTSTKPQHVTTTRVSGSGPGSKRLAPV